MEHAQVAIEGLYYRWYRQFRHQVAPLERIINGFFFGFNIWSKIQDQAKWQILGTVIQKKSYIYPSRLRVLALAITISTVLSQFTYFPRYFPYIFSL